MKNEPKKEYLPDCTEIHDDFTLGLFHEHKKYIDDEIQQYKIVTHYNDLLKKALAGKHMTHEEVQILEMNDYEFMKTSYKHMPTFCMVFDDLMGNRLIYSACMKTEVSQFFLNVRHFNTMCIFSTQIWKNGVPRSLKSNIKIYILFACKSVKHQKTIAEDVVGRVSIEKFCEIWDEACSVPYSALVVDMLAPETDMFRRNFDTILCIGSVDAETKT